MLTTERDLIALQTSYVGSATCNLGAIVVADVLQMGQWQQLAGTLAIIRSTILAAFDDNSDQHAPELWHFRCTFYRQDFFGRPWHA